jgi:hypothetical protein
MRHFWSNWYWGIKESSPLLFRCPHFRCYFRCYRFRCPRFFNFPVLMSPYSILPAPLDILIWTIDILLQFPNLRLPFQKAFQSAEILSKMGLSFIAFDGTNVLLIYSPGVNFINILLAQKLPVDLYWPYCRTAQGDTTKKVSLFF